ncbi:alpha amylase N-terminal ig-like domain-containing protein [Ligilactobacillus salivarius]|uniref:alpha amylase N-terminal ig-like domain-containing protein n=1 Tax=Ligilactobacillus salivarius TaxID=1624 RepID=UPI00237E1799|nr:alpha amylase N-terminal ig-like domain-containing protein [Ligilactobacillus salivarius]MDE1507459.1 alpha amylase N-terminal ig-like domain-containing protein [Ligilactobacillus salivarius]MDE1522198.1 alpha amylase N-terminal ig-like domain-containing protein [Ligilactobacillus salivarius]
MNLAALYHRPDSEMAYLVKKDDFQIRLRTGTNEVEAVILYYGDPYDVTINDKKKQLWEYQIQEMVLQASTSLYDYWQLNVSVPLKRLQYFFKIKFKNGEEFLYDDRHIWSYSKTHLENSSGFRMPYFHEIDRIKTPDWVKKTVWYQIFPERFANGDHSIDPKGTLPWGSEKPSRTNFFGGDLQGVIDHLDYLEDLGINGIYFCPIFAAHSNHKYDTIDYFNIDPAFGSKEKFKELVDKAHERGIKIMLDAVFKRMPKDKIASDDQILEIDDQTNRVKGNHNFSEYPHNSDIYNLSMNIFIIETQNLINQLRKGQRIGASANLEDFFLSLISRLNCGTYEYTGYMCNIFDVKSYYDANMDMLNVDHMNSLLYSSQHIITRTKNEVATHFTKTSDVKNSQFATGCVVEGYVRNSLVSRRTFISENSKVEDSIIMSNARIGKDVEIKYAILDKDVVVKSGVKIIGTPENPVVIEKKMKVTSDVIQDTPREDVED